MEEGELDPGLDSARAEPWSPFSLKPLSLCSCCSLNQEGLPSPSPKHP